MAIESSTSSLRQTLLISVVWLVILGTTSYVSYQFNSYTQSLLLYLPTALSIILIHWHGLKMLPVIYINAVFTLLMWNAKGDSLRILLLTTHEPAVALASKLLIDKVAKIKNDYLNSTSRFVQFTFFGIVIPIAVNSLYTYHYSFVNGDMQKVALLWLSDFITIFSLSLPLLFFLKPGKMLIEKGKPLPFANRAQVLEFTLVVLAFLTLSFIVPFGQYWFIYGIIAVVIAVRQGFESVLLINATIFLINYLLPLVESSTALITTSGSTQLINVHLGNATMLFISTLVGRVVSDLRATEENLLHQKIEIEKANQLLNQTNQELDRFVYSVSHDLSAPLKSIQGLIHLSRADSSKDAQESYLDMMEKSANRLNNFIGEVLDYSKTSRKELSKQQVDLHILFNELQEKFAIDDAARKASIKISLQANTLTTDPTLLKIALGNLLSNALKFQKKYQTQPHAVEIRSQQQTDKLIISIIDNGEGIMESHLEKIFDMFYRATSNAPGSGLGLYIAREATRKLGGEISVRSIYGEGSVFSITLPLH
jgi:two-component system, sensor histidine kinase